MIDMICETRISRRLWRLSSIVIDEMNVQREQSNLGGRASESRTWTGMAIIVSIVSIPIPLLTGNYFVYFGIQALLLMLVVVGNMGRIRDARALNFLISLPISKEHLFKLKSIIIARLSFIPATCFPLFLAVAMSFSLKSMVETFFIGLLSVFLSIGILFLSKFLARIATNSKHDKPRISLELRRNAMKKKKPAFRISRILFSIAFSTPRHIAALLGPVVLSIAIILAGFSSAGTNATFSFYWLFFLTGFLPFFIISTISIASEEIIPMLELLPFTRQHLFRAKQIFGITVELLIIGTCTVIFSFHVDNLPGFLILAGTLPIVNWLSCTLIIIATTLLQRIARVSLHFILALFFYNVYGGLYWTFLLIGVHDQVIFALIIILTQTISIMFIEKLLRINFAKAK